MSRDQDQFEVLRNIQKNKDISQRALASSLGFSLGKLNYILNELKKKGLIKVDNFIKSKKKGGYNYILTPYGISKKTRLTINFMKRKMKEYDELKKELEEINKKS